MASVPRYDQPLVDPVDGAQRARQGGRAATANAKHSVSDRVRSSDAQVTQDGALQEADGCSVVQGTVRGSKFMSEIRLWQSLADQGTRRGKPEAEVAGNAYKVGSRGRKKKQQLGAQEVVDRHHTQDYELDSGHFLGSQSGLIPQSFVGGISSQEVPQQQGERQRHVVGGKQSSGVGGQARLQSVGGGRRRKAASERGRRGRAAASGGARPKQAERWRQHAAEAGGEVASARGRSKRSGGVSWRAQLRQVAVRSHRCREAACVQRPASYRSALLVHRHRRRRYALPPVAAATTSKPILKDAMSAKPDKNTAIGPPLKSLSEIKGAHFWFYG
uniref:Uncharacterized protein n=2 Tax=Oryza sativa subsp. japonica TaxID=39947 RepID=Q6EPU2_ORYSJ|nr:hypothetical protein [Oryza sativa Japonica Group]